MKKAAGIESGGGKKTTLLGSGLDRVAALPVAGPDGNNRKLHLPAQSSRKEAAHRMRLPSGCLHDLVQAGPARALDQAEDRLGLARCAQAFLPRRFSELGGFGIRGGPGSRLGAFFTAVALRAAFAPEAAPRGFRAPGRVLFAAVPNALAAPLAAASLVSVFSSLIFILLARRLPR